jgi:hypothetical protein
MNKVVYLRWLDSASSDGWTCVNEDGLDEIVSIGFLIYEDDKQIQIAHSIDEFNKYCGVIAIPKSVILKRRTVKYDPA